MPFWVSWQRAGSDLCPKKEKHSSDALLGRRGRCCSLFPALCGICGESKDIVSLSFSHLEELLSWPARSLFLCLLFFAQRSFHMKLSRITHDKLSVAVAFISLLPCLSWLSIKDSFISWVSTQAMRWRCICTMQRPSSFAPNRSCPWLEAVGWCWHGAYQG